MIGGSPYFLSASSAEAAYVKLLPSDFQGNDDHVMGLNTAVLEDDSNVYGIRSHTTSAEVYATVKVPFGWKATAFKTYGNSTDTTSFIVVDMTDGSGVTDGNTGTLNGGEVVLATPTAATATNYFLLKVNVGANTDIVYGGHVKIERI